MNTEQIKTIIENIRAVRAALGNIETAMMAGLAKPVEKPVEKPVQQELDLGLGMPLSGHRERYGDVGYEDDFNPVRQAVGALGAEKASRSHAQSLDKRPRGSVMVKDMTVNEKRRYWRWAADRKTARKIGMIPPSWAKWTSNGDRLIADPV